MFVFLGGGLKAQEEKVQLLCPMTGLLSNKCPQQLPFCVHGHGIYHDHKLHKADIHEQE